MNVVLPCGQGEAAAMFTSPPWVHKIHHCTNPEDVMEVFRLYHSTTWSDVDNASTDPVLRTKRGARRYKTLRNRIKFLMEYAIQHGPYGDHPTDYGEDQLSSKDEPLMLGTPPIPSFRPVVPGDFVLTFNVLVLANRLESQFPHRAEYWWTQLDGSLDQACTCLSMQSWIDQLKTCESEESFKTTHQSFLDTTWQALEGEQQCTGEFPYVKPTTEEIRRAYPGSGANPPSKGDEAQDKEKKKDDKEAAVKDGEGEQPPETEAEKAAREAQEKITRLERQLKEARDAAAKAAEEKAERAGEDLIKELDDEKAKKERQKDKKKEKKQRKKQSKEGEVPPSGEDEDSEEEEEKEKPEGESKKPEGESKEEGDKPTTEDKKSEDKEKSEEKPKPEGEEPKAKDEGPPGT